MDKRHPKRQCPRNISFLIGLNGFFGLVGLLVFLIYLTPVQPLVSVEVSGRFESLGLDLAIAFLIGGSVHILVLYALWQEKRWARLVQKIVAIPYVLAFPLGTVYALLVYRGLNQKKVNEYFSQIN